MASIAIRNPDDGMKTRLRVPSAEHHQSVEEEAHIILNDADDRARVLSRDPATLTSECFTPIGGVEIELSPRDPMGEPLDFS